jgi:hypothetical protein
MMSASEGIAMIGYVLNAKRLIWPQGTGSIDIHFSSKVPSFCNNLKGPSFLFSNSKTPNNENHPVKLIKNILVSSKTSNKIRRTGITAQSVTARLEKNSSNLGLYLVGPKVSM